MKATFFSQLYFADKMGMIIGNVCRDYFNIFLMMNKIQQTSDMFFSKV